MEAFVLRRFSSNSGGVMADSDIPTEAFEDQSLPTQKIVNFAHFQLRSKLGSGAFGTVYLAHDKRLDREVALKIPAKAFIAVPVNRARFLREAKAAASIQHPNICPVFEVGEHAGTPFYTMSLLKGGSLRQVMERQPHWSERQVINLIRKLAAALAAAHQAGVIHRDLKPENILIDDQKQPVIADFGLAKMMRRDQVSLTQQGVVVGTPAYMSPEQVRGDEETAACDIFSLGVIFYELLCGCRPFSGTQQEVIAKIANQSWQPLPPEKHRPSISPTVSAIVMRCLSKDPRMRIGSMQELVTELRDIVKTISATSQLARESGAVSDPRLDSLVASLASLGSVPKSRIVPASMWLGGSALTAAIVLIGFFALFQSDYGKVRLQLNLDTSDPALTVFIDETEVAIESLSQELELPAGPHELVVRRNGNEIQRYAFQVIAGGTTIERLQAAKVDKPIVDDRNVAQSLLMAGAKLRLVIDQGQPQEYAGASELKEGEIRLLGVSVSQADLISLTLWQQIGRVQYLQTLIVEDARTFDDAALKSLAALPQLEILALNSIQGSFAALQNWASLPRLKSLSFAGGKLVSTEADPIFWQSLVGLKELNIARSNIAIEHLPATFSASLQRLIANHTPTSDASADWIADRSQLLEMDLSNTLITGDLLTALRGCTRLESLDLSDSMVTDRDLNLLEPLQNLRKINLSGTFVSAPAVSKVRQRIKGGEVVFDETRYRSLDAFVANAVEAAGGTVDWGTVSRLSNDAEAARNGSKDQTLEIKGLTLSGANESILRYLSLIGRLPSLRVLLLSELPVRDQDLMALRVADALEHLAVHRTSITEVGLLGLKDLQQVKHLEMDDSLLSESLVVGIHVWPLDKLVLQRNQANIRSALPWLEKLPTLTRLHLIDIPLSEFCDAFPQPLSNLRELQSSLATDEDLVLLAKWSNLESLNFSGTSLTGRSLSELASLGRLKRLDLSRTQIDGDSIESLRRLPLLEIDLSYLPLTAQAVVQLSQFARLERLELVGTAVDNASLKALAELPNLKSLNVVDAWTTKAGRTAFRSLLPQCDLLPNDTIANGPQKELVEWMLEQQGEVAVRLPDNSVKAIRDTSELPISSFRVIGVNLLNSPSGVDNEGMRKIAQFNELDELAIYGPACTDAALAQLQEMPSLRSLTIDHIDMTDRGARYLLACPNLTTLRIANAKLTDDSAALIRDLAQLQYLQLNHSGLTGASLEALVGLTNLAKLDISFPVKDHARPLSQMKSLEHLVITECNELSEEDLALLGRMRNLRHITLRNCRLSDRARAQIAGLKFISLLTLQDINFAAADFRRLAAMSQLNHLSLRGIPLGAAEIQALQALDQVRAITILDCQIDAGDSATLKKWSERRRVKLIIQ